MGKNKFKVGDKVKVLKTGNGCMGAIGKIGYITNEESHNGLCTYEKGINIKREDNGQVWRVNTDAKLELIRKKTDDTIVIYRNNNKVIALDKTTGKKAEARCNPADEFDFHAGAKLAFQRLLGEAVEDKKSDSGVREVKRKAKVGEYIKIVNGKSITGLYKNGDIGMVVIATDKAVIMMHENGLLNGCAYHEEYVVLENYKPEEKTEDDSEIYVGDMVEVVDCGHSYSTYDKWSGLGSYRQNYVIGSRVKKGMILKVLRISKHDTFVNEQRKLFLLQNPNTTQVFILNSDGIKKVER